MKCSEASYKALEELQEAISPGRWYFDDIKPHKLRTDVTDQSIAYVEPGVYVNDKPGQGAANRRLYEIAPLLLAKVLEQHQAIRRSGLAVGNQSFAKSLDLQDIQQAMEA